MPHNGSQLGAHCYAQGLYNGRDFANYLHGVGWGPLSGAYNVKDYVDSSGTLLTPPPGAGNAWRTFQMRAFGDNGTLWVFTFNGVCNPVFSVADMYGSGTMRAATAGEIPVGAPPASANRKYYIVTGVNVATRLDLATPNFSATVDGKTGEYGFSYLVRMDLLNQTSPISNMRWYPYAWESGVNAGDLVSPEWLVRAEGMGMLRFMDMNNVINFPGCAETGQWVASNITGELRKSTARVPPATKIGENHWEVQARTDAPAAYDKMMLSTRLNVDSATASERMTGMLMTVYRTGATSPAGVVPPGKTYLVCNTKTAGVYYPNGDVHTSSAHWHFEPVAGDATLHGLSNGDMISRYSDYDWDTNWNWNIPSTNSLFASMPVTVVDARTVSIDFETSAEPNPTRQAAFTKSPRIRYGGVDFYFTSHGCWGTRFDPYSDNRFTLQFKTNYLFQLLTPVGRSFGPQWSQFICGDNNSDDHWHPSVYSDLCNKVGAHCYICVPPHLTDAAATAMATHFADNLDTGIDLYVEIGNEVWNYGGHRKAMVWDSESGVISPPSGGTIPTNSNTANWQEMYGYHHRRIFKIMKSVYASKGKAGRMHGILGRQWANVGDQGTAVIFREMEPGRNYYNPAATQKWFAAGDEPRDYIDYLTLAVYYSPPWHYVDGDGLFGPYDDGNAFAVQFPGLLEAIWKWKQGGALAEEGFQFVKYWTEAPESSRPTHPDGKYGANADSIHQFITPGISRTLAAGGQIDNAISYYGKKLILYEFNNDWFPSGSARGFPDIYGAGPPSVALLATVPQRGPGTSFTMPPSGYYDTTNKHYYEAAANDDNPALSTWNRTTALDGFEPIWNGTVITRKDYLNFFLQWHWSQAHAESVMTFVDGYFQCNPGKNVWPCLFVMNNPGNYRQSFGFWLTRTLDAINDPPPSVLAYRAYDSGAIGATLTGRGYLTATASSALTAAATLAGAGSMAASASAQQGAFFGLSNYGENLALNFLLRATGSSPATVYLALHYGGTGEDGTTNEVTATGYARQAITFDAPSGGIILSSATVTFGPWESAPGTILNFSLWDAATNGNCLAVGNFQNPATPAIGYSTNVPAGGISITAV
jgi:hypothetical protein